MISPFFSPNTGGVETHLDDLCEYLRTHGYKVYVITYQPLTTKARGLKIEKKKNLEIHRIWWPGFNLFHKLELCPVLEVLYLTPRLLLAAFLFLVFHRNKINAIHTHGFNATLIARIINPFFKKRVTLSIHAIYDLKRKPFMARVIKWMLAEIETVMPLAEKSKAELMDIGIPENKIKIYTYWVKQTLFRPRDKADCQRSLRLKGKFFVLFVGRLIDKKGAGVL